MCSAKHADYYAGDCAVNLACFTIADVIVTQNYLCLDVVPVEIGHLPQGGDSN